MAGSASFTYNRWVCQGYGWQTSYDGTGWVSVNRAAGSDTATVSAGLNIESIGGDAAYWTLHLKVSDAEYTTTSSSNWHGAGTFYGLNIEKSVSVAAGAGSLDVALWLTIDDANAYSGASSEVKYATLTYDSKGSSTLASVSNVTLGAAPQVKWTPYSNAFKYKLKYAVGSWSYTTGFISPNTTNQYTYSGYVVPNTSAIWSQMPNSRTATMTVTLYSYDANGNSLGGASSKDCTVTIPASCAPTIGNVTLSEAGTGNPFNGVFVQGFSKIKVDVSASHNYSATVKKATITLGNVSYNADFSNGTAAITTEVLSTSGNLTLTVTVTDSRGLTKTQTQMVRVVPYFAPAGMIDIDISGTTVTVTAGIKVASVTKADGTQLNTCTYTITRKALSSGTATTVKSGTLTPNSAWQTVTAVQTVADVETESYEYTLSVADKKTSVTASKKTGVVVFSRLAGGKGIAMFREATAEDEGRLAIAGNLKVDGKIEGIDYVISDTTDDGWRIRKWQSGFCECYYRKNHSVECTSQWGALYFGTIGQIDLPVTFTGIPNVQANVTYSSAGGAWLSPTTTPASAVKSPSFYVLSGSSATKTVQLEIHITGMENL